MARPLFLLRFQSRWFAGFLPLAALLLMLALPWLPQSERRQIEFPWLDQQPLHQHWWIFFGYMGCADVCPDTLAQLRNAYLRMPTDLRPGVVLIDATAAADENALAHYVRGFHPNFQAYTPSLIELERLSQQFGARITPRPNERGPDHSGSVYQLNRVGDNWILTRTFQDRRLSPDKLAEAITSR